MAESQLADALVNSIREAARMPGRPLRVSIEECVEKELGGISLHERVRLLEEAAGQFGSPKPCADRAPGFSPEEAERLLSLLLGKGKTGSDLSSEDIFPKLAAALNTVFDSLNRTIRVINSTLLGQAGELETIRAIIGSEIGGPASGTSLQEYLDQIQEAFLKAHRAFRDASESMTGRILEEFDPEKMASLADGKLKFGPMKKAELFDIFAEKFESCKRSLESGRLMEEFMREFEKACQKLYKTDARREP